MMGMERDLLELCVTGSSGPTPGDPPRRRPPPAGARDRAGDGTGRARRGPGVPRVGGRGAGRGPGPLRRLRCAAGTARRRDAAGDDAVDGGGGGRDVEGADLIVTTSFYARVVRDAAERLGTPVVMLTTHPEFEAEIRRRLEAGRLTVVAVDPRFGERIRMIYGEDRNDPRIHVILADDAPALTELDPREPVLLTRAAHERLGDVKLTLLFPHAPSFSPESARELAEVLIRLNREVERP